MLFYFMMYMRMTGKTLHYISPILFLNNEKYDEYIILLVSYVVFVGIYLGLFVACNWLNLKKT